MISLESDRIKYEFEIKFLASFWNRENQTFVYGELL